MSDLTFGQLLAAANRRAGMSTNGLARETTTDRTHLDNILDDESYPGIYYWFAIYLALRRHGAITEIEQVDEMAEAVMRDPEWERRRDERSRKAALRFEKRSKKSQRKPAA